MSIVEFLGAPLRPARHWPTGWTLLDDLVGGVQAKRVWIVTGGSGDGKTTIVTQLAHHLAVDCGFVTHLACPREDEDRVRLRLMSLATLEPIWQPHSDQALPEVSDPRLERLQTADLVVQAEGAFSTPLWNVDEQRPRCWAVDDADWAGEDFESTLRKEADRGTFVVVSLPRDHVMSGPRWGDRLVSRWASVADLILEIDSIGSTSGCAILRIHKNKRGPVREMTLANSVWRARFTDMPEEVGRCTPD